MNDRTWRRPLTALILFGAAFGFIEAAVVVYLRGLYEPLHQRLYPDRPADDLFPLVRLDQLAEAGQPYGRCLAVELAREAATLVLLVSIALAVARNVRQAIAAFAIAFGLWDLCFYLFLKVLIDWPDSLFTLDLLFLLPVPWVGPVLAPVLVALALVGGGGLVFEREDAGRPLAPWAGHWAALLIGSGMLVLAFCWDWRNSMAGGEPASFNWVLFGLGLGTGVAALAHALKCKAPGLGGPAPVNALAGDV